MLLLEQVGTHHVFPDLLRTETDKAVLLAEL